MTSNKQIAPRNIDADSNALHARRPNVLASGDIARFIDRFDLQGYASYSSAWSEGRPAPANEGSAPANATARRSNDEIAGADHGPRRWLAVLGGFIAWAWRTYQREREIARSTAYLASLNDHMLRDIGLHRSEIEDAVRRGRF